MNAADFDRRLATAFLCALLVAAVIPVAAQSTERSKPPGTVPLEEVPPPPPLASEPLPEPEITLRAEGEQTVQEYRMHGKLYMQRVTPKHGVPYILMDLKGDGTFTRQDNSLDSGVRVPQWVLMEF
jgi:hypothetical protein